MIVLDDVDGDMYFIRTQYAEAYLLFIRLI